MKKFILPFLLIAAMLIASALVYPRLADMVPSHWNVYGQVDGMQPRLVAALLMPLLAAALWLLFEVLPRLDPMRRSYDAFIGSWHTFRLAIIALLALVHGSMLAAGLGIALNMGALMLAAVGLLFVVLGNEMGRLRPNSFAGIRVPWTLADPENWRQTHRVGGRAMLIGGALVMLCALLPPVTGVVMAMAILIAVIGGTILYSWRIAYTRSRQ